MNAAADRLLKRLIWLAEVPFEGIPHRQSQLARHLANHFDVLFVEPPPPRRLAREDTWLRGGVRVGQVVPLLNARPAPLRLAMHATALRRLAVWIGAAQLKRLAGNLSTSIVVCSNVYLAEAAMQLHPARMMVDICDDPRHYPGEPPWTHELLVDAIRRADLVTTSSHLLQTEFLALGARRVEYVPNGVPDDMLQREMPTRLHKEQPVVGFVGHLGPWIDVELIERVAEAMPAARVVMVGSVDAAVQPRLERLLRHRNVSYQDFVPHADVPDVIAGFDVGLMPFRVQAYTRAVNPIKLYEYAAQNVSVVSTAFSPDVEEFRNWIDVCTTADEFVAAVQKRALHGNDRPIRWIAETHTWSSIADRFASLIQAPAVIR